jgi:hypothetical protein
MQRLLCHIFAWLAIVAITGCASRDDFVCGGSFKSQAEFERVYGKQPPSSLSSTTRY